MDYGKITSSAGIPNVQIGNLEASDGTNTTVVSDASNSSSTTPLSEGRPVSTIMILAIVLPSSVVLLLGCMLVLRARRRNKADATTNSPSADSWASNAPANAPGEPAVRLSSTLGFETSKSAEGGQQTVSEA